MSSSVAEIHTPFSSEKLRELGWSPDAVHRAFAGETGAATIHAEEDLPTIWDSPADMAEFIETEPPGFDWVVDQRIQAGRGILLTGIGGSSKSTFLYHLAVGCATGSLPWDWEIAKQGKVVLVMTEDTPADAHRSVHKVTQGLSDPQLLNVAANLSIYPLAGSDVKLLALEGGTMNWTHLANKLQEKIGHLKNVVLIAIDPALEITEGDETNQSHQRSLGKFADTLAVKTGAAVILAAHSAKGTVHADELTSHSARGAGALTDAVRGEFALRTMTAKEAEQADIVCREERQRHVQLVATKGNHLPAAAYKSIWLRRDDNGALMPADIEIAIEGLPEGLTQQQQRALDALTGLSADHVPSLTEWQELLENERIIAPHKGHEAKRKEMTRIRKALFDAGQIVRGTGKGRWLPVRENNE